MAAVQLRRSGAAAASTLAIRGFPAFDQFRRHVRGAACREPADRAGTRYRREQLAALLDQRVVPLVRRGRGPGPVAVHHRDLLRLLKTTATTASGARRTNFISLTTPTVWVALSQGGVEAGYGAEFAVLGAARRRAGSSWRTPKPGRRRRPSSRAAMKSCRSTAWMPSTATRRPTSTCSTRACFPMPAAKRHTFHGAQHRRRHAHGHDRFREHHARAGADRHDVHHRLGPGGLHPVQRPHRHRRNAAQERDQRARQRERHRPDPRSALQRRRLSRSRERARVHDRQHHADQRAHVREASCSTTRIRAAIR